MEPRTHPPSISEVPTISDGDPPPKDVQARVVSNQVQAARAWNDTAQDIVVNNVINENFERRESRRELLILLCLALILLVVGSVYAYRNYTRDRFVDRQEVEATNTPYRPETVR